MKKLLHKPSRMTHEAKRVATMARRMWAVVIRHNGEIRVVYSLKPDRSVWNTQYRIERVEVRPVKRKRK